MLPKIICHMISSIDGRLIPSRWTLAVGEHSFSSGYELYEEVANKFDAQGWIVGRSTMEGLLPDDPTRLQLSKGHDVNRTTFIGKPGSRQLAIAIDPSGKLRYRMDSLSPEHHVAIIGPEVSDDYLAELRALGISYIIAGPGGSGLRQAFAEIAVAFGVSTLLLEGGGITNGMFLQESLIDEISLLIYPGIDGQAGIPSVFDCPGSAEQRPAGNQRLELLSAETLEGGVVWLRHKVIKPIGASEAI